MAWYYCLVAITAIPSACSAPLTIADETLDEGLDIIEKSLVEINTF